MSFVDAHTSCPACQKLVPLSCSECPHCGVSLSSGEFVQFRRPDGSKGIVDQTTLAFLRCAAPEPSQEVLDQLLSRSKRVQLLHRVNGPANTWTLKPAVELPASDFPELRASLRIIDGPQGHVMTFGEHALAFLAGDIELARVELLGCYAIRWEQTWKSDAPLQFPARIAELFSRHGLPELLSSLHEDEIRARESEQSWTRWNAATPECIRDLVLPVAQDPFTNQDYAPILRALAATFPDEVDRAAVVLAWYGSGEGSWSAYPVYEGIPDQILLSMPLEAIVIAASRPSATAELLIGAARFFACGTRDEHRKRSRKRVPDELQARLIDHVVKQGDADNIERMQQTFRKAER